MFDKIKAVFKQDVKAETLPEKDVGWSERSAIYTLRDFEKYNPDDLIGRKGYGIYRKMMIDEQVKAVVKFKRDAVTSRDYMFELDGEKYNLSEEECQRRIALSNEIIEQLQGSWMDAVNGIMSAIYNGFSMTEKIFDQIEFDGVTWWGLKKLKLKPYDTFYFDVDEFGEIVKTIQKIDSREQEINEDKFIKYIVNPDVDEHYGSSELREAYRSWFSKDIIIKFRNMWLERHAGGFRMIQAKEGKTITAGTTEYNNLQNALNNINTSSGIILPSSVTLDSDYPSNNVAFKEAIDDSDTAIARALLVPNLLGVSPQGNVGSYSQSTNQLEAFLWTLEADAIRLEEVINEQLFRQLGKVNFGDDGYPRFKFKPASGSKKLEIITAWKELVSGGAAIHTDTDEKHLRGLLDFPEAGEEIKTNEQSNSGTTIPENTGDGNIDPASGDNAGDNGNDNNDGDSAPLDNEEDMSADEKDKKKKKEMDSTIIGKGVVEVSAFSKALKRVNFAAIAKAADDTTEQFTERTASIMDSIVDDLITKAKEGGDLSEDITNNIKLLKINPKLKRKLNTAQTAMLRSGFKEGVKNASSEVDKAKQSEFSRNINMERLDLIAEDYFKLTAFKITGNLTDDAVKLIEQAILNGARYDKTWQQVEKDIYQTFATKGMISPEQAVAALGEALNVSNPDARLRTIVRTGTFDAINTARQEYFNDPSLGGFVVAFEYSAILDDRTTQICRHLDDDNRGNHSKKWYEDNAQYTPPNHFNCRSLLIAVTTADEATFVEGGEPTIEPQDGFR